MTLLYNKIKKYPIVSYNVVMNRLLIFNFIYFFIIENDILVTITRGMMMELVIEHLQKYFEGKHVLEDIDFRFEKGKSMVC